MEEIKKEKSPDTPFKKKAKAVKDFLASTTNGMAIGLFGTLIIGTIIGLFAKIPSLEAIGAFATVLKGLMGAGIGLGIALVLHLNGIYVVTLMAAGMVGNLTFSFATGAFTTVSDPLSCYVSTILCYFSLILLHKKKTPVDLIIVPLLGLSFSLAYTFLLSAYVHDVTVGLGLLIQLSFAAVPLAMCVVVAVLVGLALTGPLSSVALCVAINIGATPLAAGAALIGCCSQMVGFAVETAYDNKWGSVLAVGLGTSKLQFKNIVKKPLIWLPTILCGALLAPFALLFNFATDSVGAGMGTSGLVGIINTFDVMNYAPWAMAEVALVCVAGPILLTFFVDWIFRKAQWIKRGDFFLSNDL
jgi:uncharacterized membrane protein